MVSWQVGRLTGWLDRFPLQLMKGDSWQGLEVVRLLEV